METANLDLSDVYPRHARELEAFREAAREVARDIFREHLREPLRGSAFGAVREALPLFGQRLLDYLLDRGDLRVDRDGVAHAGAELDAGGDWGGAVEAYGDGGPRRSSTAYFLRAVREVAGGVLAGHDGFRLLRMRDARGLMEQWEHLMLHTPVLEPCRLFAARAVASRLRASPSPRVVLEGGAGVGVVLRTLLDDPGSATALEGLGVWHFTELDPLLLARGRAAIQGVAPSLMSAVSFRRLDLDALPGDLGAAGVSPGSVDCVVLEHVLYDLADLHGALVSLRRLLRPDGALIFTGAFRGPPRSFFPCEMLQLTLASYRRARLDPPWRSNAGYLSLGEWDRSLRRAGFTATVLPSEGDQTRVPHGGVIALPA